MQTCPDHGQSLAKAIAKIGPWVPRRYCQPERSAMRCRLRHMARVIATVNTRSARRKRCWRQRMCGITGWVSFDRDLSGKQDVIGAMTATMACRGPDASGTWQSRRAVLGHRRLAVIDLPGGV